MVNNEEKLVSVFQEKAPIRFSTFGSKQFQNGRLMAILNFNNFVYIYIYVTQKKCKISGP